MPYTLSREAERDLFAIYITEAEQQVIVRSVFPVRILYGLNFRYRGIG